MKKHPPEVEWIVTESDVDWERLSAQSLPDGTPIIKRRLHRTWPLWSTIALLLVAVMSSGGWWWRSTQIRVQRMAAQPLDPIPLDSNAMVMNAQGNQRSLIAWYQFARKVSGLQTAIRNDDPAAHLDIPPQTIKVQRDYAVAQVIIYNAHGAPAYRQLRFYQYTANGWLRTAPAAELWGAERSLETAYFVYHFRQNDAAAVTAVVPQIDALYATLRRNFGLALPSSQKSYRSM